MSKQHIDTDESMSNGAPEARPKFWMTVGQAENPVEFAKSVPGEFQLERPRKEGAGELDRRDFLKVSGAGALMAALAGCTRRPVQKIVPYVTNPQEIIPGMPNFYASADPATGYGLVLRCREGRPIKVDGNADHPMNKGALSASGQAMVHDLYDPDRLRAPQIGGSEASWEDFDKQASAALAASKGSTWLLTATTMSPTLDRVVKDAGIHHVMLDAASMDDVLEGQAQSYGSRVFPRYRFDRADFVLSFGADFLGTWGSTVEYTKQFSEKRRLTDGGRTSAEGASKPTMSKLVVVEPVMSVTGQNADHRIPVHPADMLTVALSVANEVAKRTGKSADELGAFAPGAVAQQTGVSAEKIGEIAEELVKNRGRGLVVGRDFGARGVALQNVVNFINSALDNEGSTVDGTNYSMQFQGSHSELEKLLNGIRTGTVKTLIISGVNPAYLFAEPLKVKEALKKVPNLIYFTQHADETAELAKFVAAESHPFEAWGDVAPLKDVYSIQQPTIRPLWQTRSLLESLLAWTSSEKKPATELSFAEVQKTAKEWQGRHAGGKSFQDWWDDLLMSGVAGSAPEGKGAARPYHGELIRTAAGVAKTPVNKGGEGEFTLVLTHSVQMLAGCQANNAGLQELPDPVSKATWGNYLAMSPETAKRLGYSEGDFVKVETSSGTAELPMYRQPGIRDGVVSAHLGYGRKFKGRVGNDVGVSLTAFTASEDGIHPRHMIPGVRLARTGQNERVAQSQITNSLEGRDIIFDTTLEEFLKNPRSGVDSEIAQGQNPASIWSGFEYKGYRWGMSIDLGTCTGCSACVIACNVENNVAAVGKDQVQKNREMQWIRIDRYYSGDPSDPETVLQPMLCQHCENAPCETVCPVLATTHSDEGLNQMVYNRCVGTKYCENNCPYKVRRFNWFNNNGDMNGSLEHPIPLMKNPEVTLRSRGVMEKCTFCVQRIEFGKSRAKTEGRRVNDDDIRTACQDACPADAIVFGDMNNPNSRVSKMKKNPRGFFSLEDVNTRPSITYLTKVRNRAPEGRREGAPEKSEAGEGKKAEHT